MPRTVLPLPLHIAPLPIPAQPPVHLFTVDVEEYFHAAALERAVARTGRARLERRVLASTERLLELLEAHGARGTFFVLGEVARETPEVVRRIAAAGHEVGSHGWSHRRVTTLSPRELRVEAGRSKAVLEDLTGTRVLGFRAPNFALTPGCDWAFDVLLERGFRYDSSVLTVARRGTGFPGAPPRPYPLPRKRGTLLEVPLTPGTVGPLRWAATGGAYFRLLPYALTRAALRQAERRGDAGVFYLHPWELDPEQPRLPVGPLTRLRHHGGVARVEGRLRRLLAEFRFTSIAVHLGLAPSSTAGAVRPSAEVGT